MRKKNFDNSLYNICDKIFNSIQNININSIKFYVNRLKYIDLDIEEHILKKPIKIFKKKYIKWENEYDELLLRRKDIIKKINQLIYDEK